MVCSESPVPHNTNNAAKHTNCAMLQEVKISTLYNSRTSRLCGMNSFRNWFRDGMCSVFFRIFVMSWNVISCQSSHRR